MNEKPRMKKISSFQVHYLRLLRRVKGSPPDKILEKASAGAEQLLQKFADEEGIREALGKLWAQTISVFEKHIPNNPKQSANQIRKIATASAEFLINKFGKEGGLLIKDIYKTAITQFLLLENNKELGMRIAKRIATDGAANVRKIELEDIAKEILKMPFMKVKPRASMM